MNHLWPVVTAPFKAGTHHPPAMDILPAMRWRYATKGFDPAKRLTDAQVDELLEVARLAPSSFGLAPWKFVLVNDPSVRRRIRDEAGHQPQMTDASHLVVFCAKDDITERDIKEFVTLTARTRGTTPVALQGFHDMLAGFRKGVTAEWIRAWCERQLYIPLGMLLEAAALRGIDAGPMEGFDGPVVDRILGLRGAHAVAMVALGYRSPDDKYASAAKVRAPRSDVVVEK